jgi:hypothetical protein
MNWHQLSLRTDLTDEFILSNIDGDWKFSTMSLWVSEYVVENAMEKPWNYSYLTNNKNISLGFILRNKEKPWNWGNIWARREITIEFVEALRFDKVYKPYWTYMASNPNMEYMVYVRFLNYLTESPISMRILSANIPYMEIVDDNPVLLWDWAALSMNRAMTEEMAEKYTDYLDWKTLSRYMTFTHKFYKRNHLKMDLDEIYRNTSLTSRDYSRITS